MLCGLFMNFFFLNDLRELSKWLLRRPKWCSYAVDFLNDQLNRVKNVSAGWLPDCARRLLVVSWFSFGHGPGYAVFSLSLGGIHSALQTAVCASAPGVEALKSLPAVWREGACSLADQRRSQSIRKGSIVGDPGRQGILGEQGREMTLCFYQHTLLRLFTTTVVGGYLGSCSPVVSMKGKECTELYHWALVLAHALILDLQVGVWCGPLLRTYLSSPGWCVPIKGSVLLILVSLPSPWECYTLVNGIFKIPLSQSMW